MKTKYLYFKIGGLTLKVSKNWRIKITFKSLLFLLKHIFNASNLCNCLLVLKKMFLLESQIFKKLLLILHYSLCPWFHNLQQFKPLNLIIFHLFC